MISLEIRAPVIGLSIVSFALLSPPPSSRLCAIVAVIAAGVVCPCNDKPARPKACLLVATAAYTMVDRQWLMVVVVVVVVTRRFK